jgi:hypothetical protein
LDDSFTQVIGKWSGHANSISRAPWARAQIISARIIAQGLALLLRLVGGCRAVAAHAPEKVIPGLLDTTCDMLSREACHVAPALLLC